MAFASVCAHGEDAPSSAPGVPAGGSGSRPDLARSRPCDLRGPLPGPPAASRPVIAAIPFRRLRSPAAGVLRRWSPRGWGSRAQSDPAPPPSGSFPARARTASRGRVSLRRRSQRDDPRLLGPCHPCGSARAGRPRRLMSPSATDLAVTDSPGKRDARRVDTPHIPVRPGFAARALMVPIRAWRLLSVHLPPRCRFHPSCSQYALEALTLHGALRGAVLAIRRVGRCHPWHQGGLDPVPPTRTVQPNTCSYNAATPRAAEES